MNIIKTIVKAVWPIIYRVLEKYADRTETQIDDIAVQAANAGVMEWLDDETETEQDFE